MDEKLERFADALAEAWRSGGTIPLFRRDRPLTRAEGYAVQDRMAERIGERVSGWKVGAAAAAVQRMEGHDGPIPGRFFASRTFTSGATLPASVFPRAKVECEIALRLTRDVAVRARPYSAEELLDGLVLHPAVEIAGTRYDQGSVLDTFDAIADNGNGAGFVSGAATEALRGFDIHAVTIDARISGGAPIQVYTGELRRDPLEVTVETINAVIARGFPLAASLFISTGSLTMPVPILAGQSAVIRFGALGTVNFALG